MKRRSFAILFPCLSQLRRFVFVVVLAGTAILPSSSMAQSDFKIPVRFDEGIRLSVGTAHSCVRRGDQLDCFGALALHKKLAPSLGLPTAARQVSSGGNTCFLNEKWQVRCFGRPALPVPKGARFTQIAVGQGFVCALGDGRSLRCSSTGNFAPRIMSAFRQRKLNVNQIAAGGKNLCILDDNGHPSCLSGPLQTYLKSRNRSRALPSLVGLSVGPTFACGLHKKSKHVFCFGERAFDLPLPAGPMKQVSVGGLHACAVDVKGALSCFGLRDVFQQVKNAPSGNFVEVAAGQSHSCALDDEGAVHCWGANTRGQCMP